jgi:toxin YoeB
MAKKAKSKPKPASNKPAKRETVFQNEFLEDLRFWVETERNTALKILELIEAIQRNPFSGIGKPEPLKYLAPGTWSRRITQEHRLVYLVRDDRVDFLQARYHY